LAASSFEPTSRSIPPLGDQPAALICWNLELLLPVSVHVVAARGGHDPAVLLRNCAKRTKKADVNAASMIGMLTATVL
jgi:hypothetical protein